MGIYTGAKNKIFFKTAHGYIYWWVYILVHHCTDGQNRVVYGELRKKTETLFLSDPHRWANPLIPLRNGASVPIGSRKGLD